MSNIPFVCKKCGSKTIKTTTKPKSLDDFDGAVCANCGASMNKDEIERQTRKIAADLVREAFRKAGFK